MPTLRGGWRYDAAGEAGADRDRADAGRRPYPASARDCASSTPPAQPRIERLELTAATGQFAFAADAEPASVTLDPNTWVLMQVCGVRQALKEQDMQRQTRRIRSLSACALASATAQAQYYQTDFPAEEFKSRHARVFEQIGATAVAVVQGVRRPKASRCPASTTPSTTCRASRRPARTCCSTAARRR